MFFFFYSQTLNIPETQGKVVSVPHVAQEPLVEDPTGFFFLLIVYIYFILNVVNTCTGLGF